jgi:hypothetical protein
MPRAPVVAASNLQDTEALVGYKEQDDDDEYDALVASVDLDAVMLESYARNIFEKETQQEINDRLLMWHRRAQKSQTKVQNLPAQEPLHTTKKKGITQFRPQHVWSCNFHSVWANMKE